MPQGRLPQPKNGELLRINDRAVPFSLWPVVRGYNAYKTQRRIFTPDPWSVIRRSITAGLESEELLNAAYAFLEQSQDFYNAVMSARVSAAKPLLLYYSFLNLVKSFVILKGQFDPTTFTGKENHGLSEPYTVGMRELYDATLVARKTTTSTINFFNEFMLATTGSALPGRTEYDLPILLNQILPGHRLWTSATEIEERFVSVEPEFIKDQVNKQVFVRLFIMRGDLRDIGVRHEDLLANSQLAGSFQQVETPINRTVLRTAVTDYSDVLCFEQIVGTPYTRRPADVLVSLVQSIRPYLWQAINSSKPYRRYYVCLAPPVERSQVIAQLLSIYATTFYFGSITRYRPHHFDLILESDAGPFVEAFLDEQPLQFLYLMTSQFAKREVVQPALAK